MFNTGLLAVLPISVTAFFVVYLIFKAIDFVTGLLKTVKDPDNRYRSSKMREGLVTWMGEMAGIVFVMTIDIVLGLNFLLCMSTLALFIYKEGGSILENLLACGVELPIAVADKLEVFNKNNNNEGDVK